MSLDLSTVLNSFTKLKNNNKSLITLQIAHLMPIQMEQSIINVFGFPPSELEVFENFAWLKLICQLFYNSFF